MRSCLHLFLIGSFVFSILPAYSKQIYLLIYASRGREGIASTTMPMDSMEQCQAAGLKIIAKKFKHSNHEFECVIGGSQQ